MSDIENEYQVQIKPNTEDNEDFPDQVVIIPIMNSPIFPGMIAPIILTEDKYTSDLDEYLGKNGYLALNLVKSDLKDEEGEFVPEEQIDLDSREIRPSDVYKVGVICKVLKKLKLPDGSVNILVHGLKRFRIDEFLESAPLLLGSYEVFDDILESDEELDAYTRSVINQVKKLSEINPYFNEEMKLAMLNSPSPGALADLVAFAISLDIPEAQDFLETLVVKKRFVKLLVYLMREKDVADIQKKISDEVNDKVNKYQREYFLREQLKVIRSELGMEEDEKSRDVKKFREKIEEMGMPEDARKAALDEIDRLEVIPDSSPEYNVARTYMNWLMELPWSQSTEDKVDIQEAQKILEHDHYGLEKAKERILEFLAVRKLKPEFDGTILCLVGPPGVGKTSLGRSIAQSMGRTFYRFSLGGMRDEAEIKGHRRTYVGAMPGRIIQALKRVEVNNPVMMLDEIDKLGNSYQGDPASALLEVLDPEQNKSFIDHYLDIPFDLSKVMFIATANYIGNIPEPLLDRMEVIELSGYTIEEKITIANKWVIPKQLKKHGLERKDFSLSVSALKKLVSDYAREPGVRTMEQYIAKLCRKAALEKVSRKRRKKFSPAPEALEELLGGARFQTELAQKSTRPGIVTGLAWTAYGGDILHIETLPLRGKGGLKLTGQLGSVMNESANIAYSYVKKLLQQEQNEIAPKKASAAKKKTTKKGTSTEVAKSSDTEEVSDYLGEHEVHLHLPAGATPKDGPSAGVAMALAFYSLASNRKIKPDIAMTGELSLTGRVLPVGGIKEKVLAAKRAGIKTIILPVENEKDLKEVPERHRKGLKFHPVAFFDEALKVALPRK
jgi:ATP-dependent Lon protease